MTDRPSLLDASMDGVWSAVRQRLERQGLDNRGRLRLPPLAAGARLTLAGLVGKPVGKTIDLAAVEEALRALHVGPDLPTALSALGHPVSPEPARRRESNVAARAAREAARQAAGTWPEAWAAGWIDEVIRARVLRGMDAGTAVALVRSVRELLDRVEGFLHGTGTGELGRVDLAAGLFGSSHALDPGTRLEAAATRALGHLLGDDDPRELWARAGAHLDLTSGPVLTWRLPVRPDSALAPVVEAPTALGMPCHLTQFALRKHPVTVPAGADILVVENPRVVEAAAQREVPQPMVATNGNPSGAVLLLLGQLLTAGANLRYHGDFDTAGLAICARLHDLGLVPWHMGATDYLAALADASRAGITLPGDAQPVPPTPWDPEMQPTFATHRRAIHEERLLDDLLDPSFGDPTHPPQRSTGTPTSEPYSVHEPS